MDIPEDVADAYRVAAHEVNGALTAVIHRHSANDEPRLVRNYIAARDAYLEQSERVTGVLLEQRLTANSRGDESDVLDVENALAFAALVDGLIGLRSLLAVPDDQTPMSTSLRGVSSAQLARRLSSVKSLRVRSNLEFIRGHGVSEDLVTAALTGVEAASMPEKVLFATRRRSRESNTEANVFWMAFDLRLDPASGTLVDATKDLTTDLLVGWVGTALGLFRSTEQAEHLYDALREIDTHYLRVELRVGACACLRLLMRKMRSPADELFEAVQRAASTAKQFAVTTVRTVIVTALRAKTRINQRSMRIKPSQPAPDAKTLGKTVLGKDATAWKVVFALADHAFPLVAAGANLFGLGGVPIVVILVVALLLVECGLLDRTLIEILRQPGKAKRSNTAKSPAQTAA